MGLTSRTRSDLARDAWLVTAELFLSDTPIGTHVRAVGGFEHGLVGHLVGVRRHASANSPVASVLVGERIVGGFDLSRIDPTGEPKLYEYSAADEIYVLECYRCGALGTNHVFGFGFDRKCFACGSGEVHGR